MKWQRVENLRVDHDMSQQKIADLLFCQREVYRRYEKGTRELPLSYAIILAKFYGVSIDYLVGLTDQKTPYPKSKNTDILEKNNVTSYNEIIKREE